VIDLAVIIVSWNVCDFLLDALRTLYDDLAESNLDATVIVVDNASSDNSVEAVRQHFPQVELIASEENLGFAGGNNLGMQHLGFGEDKAADELSRAVYLLNSDTLTEKGATQTLFDSLMSDENNGLVGAHLTYGDGSFQHSSFRFPDLMQLWVEFFPTPGRLVEGRFNGRYPRESYHGESPFEVDFMLGATMMIRREVILETGLFDPQFFMYCEEIDWQWRMRKAAWRIFCVPQAHVIHLGGQSTGQVKARSVINLWDSRLRLFKKHYSLWKLALAKRMIISGMNRKIQQARREGADETVIEAYRTVQELARK
jgi:N-acetylglucosaminyl-diphospho-decaprenol L-rhamnosyltransferase